ncbi:hypothetical protein ALC57_11518 [Trachymyrmex cornetzi]|uniref:Uncharacterized protein n=1 Tax=Trachymyrmex cornetzi TaxID=471704 RepID=A0A151J2Y8_9HYME|nr:hypothetical protein ALC57_11518 [Trachymyrmex cornetzi]
MQKLKLLQNLRLPEKQNIDFLISGIGSPSLRASVSLIQAETILIKSYNQRNNTDANLVKFLNEIAGVEINFTLEREEDRELALNATEKIKSYNKLYYDKHHRKPLSYKPGDLVMIRDVLIKAGECKKLKSEFKGPFRVTKVLDKNRYVVQDIPGSSLTSRSYNSILSPDRLKLWIKTLPNHNHDVQIKV